MILIATKIENNNYNFLFYEIKGKLKFKLNKKL